MNRRRALGCIGSLMISTVGLSAIPRTVMAAPAAGTQLFGYRVRPGTGAFKFPKWQGALTRYFDERKLLERPCDRRLFSACQLHEWERTLSTIGAAVPDLAGRAQAVNLAMNDHAYVLDQVNWGVTDYWASPGEFLRKNGDCEDFAIAKYMSLRRLGVPADEMSVVVVDDRNLRVPHAVMPLRIGADTLVLDNQIDRAVSQSVIRHYRPIYAVSENFWAVFTASRS